MPLSAPPFRSLYAPSAALPLSGLTVLAVEDSRFACDALRLLCQRLGGRLRRADSLHTARAHLKVYRPDVVIVDLGLPDGRGEGLIRELVRRPAPRPVVLGTSGDSAGRADALAAGAAGFLEKPLESLAAFAAALSRHMVPADDAAFALPPMQGRVSPDDLALRDDLTHAACLMADDPDAKQRDYLIAFVAGLGRSAHDVVLERAAVQADDVRGFARLSDVIAARIHAAPDAIATAQATARLP